MVITIFSSQPGTQGMQGGWGGGRWQKPQGQEEAGCSLAPLDKSIHQSTCQGHVFSWDTTNKLSYFTLTAAQAVCGRVCDGQRCTCQFPHLWLINQSVNPINYPPFVCSCCSLGFIPCHAKLSTWAQPEQSSDRTYPHQTFRLESGWSSPDFWPWTVTAAPWAAGTFPQAPDSPSLGEVMVLTLILSLQTSWWHCL